MRFILKTDCASSAGEIRGKRAVRPDLPSCVWIERHCFLLDLKRE